MLTLLKDIFLICMWIVVGISAYIYWEVSNLTDRSPRPVQSIENKVNTGGGLIIPTDPRFN